MAFYPISIAQCPGFGFTGGPEFQTDIKNAQNGREYRNGDWAICRHKYTVPFIAVPDEAYLSIKEVFLIVRGRLHTFLHKDWADYQAENSEFAVADGISVAYRLKKTSQVGAASYERIITKPQLDGLSVTINGVVQATNTYSVDSLTGLITFDNAPPLNTVLRWSGTFDVQVRFDIDYLPFSLDNANAGGYLQNGSVDLIEVLDE